MDSSLTKLACLVLVGVLVATVAPLFSSVDPGSEMDLREQSHRARMALFRMNTAAIENLANLPGFRVVVLSEQPVHGTVVYAIPDHGGTAYRLSSAGGYQFAKIGPQDDRSKPDLLHWLPLR